MIRGRFVVIISMGHTAEQRPFPPTYTPTSALVRCQNSSVPLTAVNLIKRTVKKKTKKEYVNDKSKDNYNGFNDYIVYAGKAPSSTLEIFPYIHFDHVFTTK